jgi:predicted oxidoreductase
MKMQRLGRTDLMVSRLAYGCAMLGNDWNSPDFAEKAGRAISAAYDNGIRLFDLADVYGDGKAEIAMGTVLKQSPALRDAIVIQTKCGDRFKEGAAVDNSRRHIQNAVEESLRRLKTDRVDLLLLHWPDSLVDPHDVASAFHELHRGGKVRYFGVSNHNPWQIELLAKYIDQPIVTSQIQLGLLYWSVVQEGFKASLMHGCDGAALLDYCRVHDIQVQAYSPLKGRNIGRRPDLAHAGRDASMDIQQLDRLLASTAKRHHATRAALMLAWLLYHPAAVIPIIGSIQPRHITENCLADQIELSREEWYSLLEAASAARASR